MNETRFACICMSPALDATVRLPCAPRGDGEIFKDVEEETNVGGKAVNVARWLALRGAKVACGGVAAAPKVDVVDTTAAGDTMLAEYCWRMFDERRDPSEAARWAVAAGSAACTMPG